MTTSTAAAMMLMIQRPPIPEVSLAHHRAPDPVADEGSQDAEDHGDHCADGLAARQHGPSENADDGTEDDRADDGADGQAELLPGPWDLTAVDMDDLSMLGQGSNPVRCKS